MPHFTASEKRPKPTLFILGQGWGLWLPPTSTSPASLHTWPGEGAYRGKGEYREGPSVPWQLASAWAGSCSAPCTWSLLAGLAVYCDEQSGGSCFCGGREEGGVCLAEVKRLWEGLWSHQELVSGVRKSSTCVGTSWNNVRWLSSLPHTAPRNYSRQ